jgi:hypothetical protein
MCCQRLPTSFFSTPGSVCPIASGMQIVAYGQPLDTDQDFFPDYRDNCPYVANTFGQGDDDDGDGIGNACDPCPAVPGITCDAGATPRASCADLLPGIFPPNGAACQPVDPRAGLSPQPFCVPNQGGADGPLNLDFVGCKRGPSEMEGAPCSNGVCCYWIETMAYAGAPGDACAYAGGMDIVAYGEALDTDQDGIPDYQEPCPEVPGVTCTDARTP